MFLKAKTSSKNNREVSTRGGFTLIELLVVITVIGLLSAMVLVGLSGARSQGRDTRRVADLRNVQNALEVYFNSNNAYPSDTTWSSLETTLINAGIGVSKLPTDPVNNATYFYGYGASTDGLDYVLSATLEHGNSNLLDDDADGPVHGVSCNDPVYCLSL
jgi:prepilin-type N-terminal cleavage/methylation domain-containing protein